MGSLFGVCKIHPRFARSSDKEGFLYIGLGLVVEKVESVWWSGVTWCNSNSGTTNASNRRNRDDEKNQSAMAWYMV